MSDQDHPRCQEDTHCSTGEAPTADESPELLGTDADAACIDTDAAEVAGSAGDGGVGDGDLPAGPPGGTGGVRGADHCPALAPMGFPVGRPMALQ